MNKNLLLMLFLGIILVGCSQSSNDSSVTPVASADPAIGCTDPLAQNYKKTATTEDCSCEYSMATNVSTTVPNQFTTKVLLEEMTGTWCGWCVDGTVRMETMIDNGKGQVIGACIHQGDPMENSTIFGYFRNTFRVSSFPSGLVNRRTSAVSQDIVMTRSEWEISATQLAKTKADFGLAIDASISGNSLNVLVHVANKIKTSEKFRIKVYLLEDGLVYPQQNYQSGVGDSKHPFFSKPRVINDFVHNKVVRKTLTSVEGMGLPEAAKDANKIYKRMFITDIREYKKDKLRIVVFIMRDGESITARDIINVQELIIPASGSGSKNFD